MAISFNLLNVIKIKNHEIRKDKRRVFKAVLLKNKENIIAKHPINNIYFRYVHHIDMSCTAQSLQGVQI